MDRQRLEQVIDAYCAAWSEADEARRRIALCVILADSCLYCDPSTRVEGFAAFIAHISAVQRIYPGARVERVSRVDVHHEIFRFGWHMVLADGTVLPEGIDVVVLTPDGQWRSIIGFFGALKKP